MRELKPNKKKIQGAETKKRLYEIAEKLFREHDFASVSVEDITYEAGITKGAFYVHFESKDTLIAELITDYAIRADLDYKLFLEALPDNMPASDVLLALTEKIADVLTDKIGLQNMKKVYQILLAGTVNGDALKSYNRELYTLFHSVLEQGIQKKELQSFLPVEILSRHFVIALRGITYEWCIQHPSYNLKEQAVEHCKLLINGIKCASTD